MRNPLLSPTPVVVDFVGCISVEGNAVFIVQSAGNAIYNAARALDEIAAFPFKEIIDIIGGLRPPACSCQKD